MSFLRSSRVYLVLLAACFPGVAFGQSSDAKRPNLLVVMADDLGMECLSLYGGPIETPRLAALAKEGMRFTNAYSMPVCTPTRVQILTGRYNHRNYQGFGYLDPGEVTFANVLRDAGYRTAIAGKWQLCGDADTIRGFGFETHCLWNMNRYEKGTPDAGQPENWRKRYWEPRLYIDGEWVEGDEQTYGPDLCTEHLLSFFEKRAEDGEPFLAYYPMILTHDPFVPTPHSEARERKNKQLNFADMVRYTDHIVGRLVDGLEELGLRENTIVMFTGDNGTHRSLKHEWNGREVQGGKALTLQSGIHVPLIVSGPVVFQAGWVEQGLVDFSDFFPTLVRLAGAKLPEDRVIDGMSFVPRLKGQEIVGRTWVFGHYWGKRGRTRKNAQEYAFDGRWKLYDDGRLFDVQADPLEKEPKEGAEHDAECRLIRWKLQKIFEQVHARDAKDR